VHGAKMATVECRRGGGARRPTRWAGWPGRGGRGFLSSRCGGREVRVAGGARENTVNKFVLTHH
jgi:hypothetical protein